MFSLHYDVKQNSHYKKSIYLSKKEKGFDVIFPFLTRPKFPSIKIPFCLTFIFIYFSSFLVLSSFYAFRSSLHKETLVILINDYLEGGKFESHMTWVKTKPSLKSAVTKPPRTYWKRDFQGLRLTFFYVLEGSAYFYCCEGQTFNGNLKEI